MQKMTPEELGIDMKQHIQTLSVEEPPARKAGIKVETVDDLVKHLKTIGSI